MAKRINVTSVDGLWAGLRALPKEAANEVRDASQESASDVADKAQAKGRGVSRMYATYVAPTIKARRDRVPVIRMGGAKRIRRGNERQRVGDLLFGAEYGGGARPTTRQFLPHLGTTGYALWPTIRQELPEVIERWEDAVIDATVKSLRGR